MGDASIVDDEFGEVDPRTKTHIHENNTFPVLVVSITEDNNMRYGSGVVMEGTDDKKLVFTAAHV